MNNDKSKKGCCKDHIEGIKCDVRNCMYHDMETHCTAGQISVGPCNATSSTETVCATFKERK